VTPPPTSSSALEKETYATVTRRLLPLLFICYILSYIDRINVGFAKLQMAQDLKLSNAAFGAGAGVFFLGYFLFEIPANLLLIRLGANIWLGGIVIGWGIASTCTAFVASVPEFYLVRFLLGMLEAGFFPGVIFYLTFWYTKQYHGRIISLFMSAIPLSGVVSGAVSGWILGHMTNVARLRGWQWLYILEGIPPIIAGLFVLVLLPETPATTPWLRLEQKELLANLMAGDSSTRSSAQDHFLDALKMPAVWLLCLVFFGFVMASYGIGFWLPQILSESSSKDPWTIGLLSMIPWGLGAVAMIAVGRHSDITGERCWHVSLSGITAVVGFAVSAIPHLSPALGLAALSVATAGVMASVGTFWSLTAGLLRSTAAAAGIAWINSVGSLAGYVSPYWVGQIRDRTNSMAWPLLLFSGSCLVSASAVLLLRVNISGSIARQAPSVLINSD
jgi:sugar phosphate permease